MKHKVILVIFALFFLGVNSVFAGEAICNDLSISIHNTSIADTLTVDYVLPDDAGKSVADITVAPGETVPLVTAINPYVGFFSIRPHDNVWVGITVYNGMHDQVFKGVIIKDVARLILTSVGQGVLYSYSVDPAGKIYKSSDSVFDDGHYTYTEEKNSVGSCVDSIAGQYTFAIGTKAAPL